MRGQHEQPGSLVAYVSIEERIPASHPLRRIRKLADQALDRLNPTFCQLYALEGRPS
ncbi:MAG: IS5/IS1182 family transposase, partial [Cyanobacteriota bacterium]